MTKTISTHKTTHLKLVKNYR